MGMGLGRLGLGFSRMGSFGGASDPIPGILAKYGTPAFLVGDPNPALLTRSSQIPRSYLDSVGITASTASADTLGLLLDRSQGAALGAEGAVNGGFDTDTAWTKGSGWAISGGTANRTADGAATVLDQAYAFVEGCLYRVSVTVSNYSAGALKMQFSGGSTVSGQSITANGIHTELLYAIAGSSVIRARADAATECSIDNVSIKQVSGNHLIQATGADEPSLINSGGLWRLRGDGVSDNFLTTWYPAAASTLMVALTANAVNDFLAGAFNGISANFATQTNASGQLQGRLGSEATLTGGGSILGIPGIAIIRVDGTVSTVGWKPYNGALSYIYQGAQVGSVPTTTALRLFSRDESGTASTACLNGDIYRALAQQSAYTDAEIAAVAEQWSRELGWNPINDEAARIITSYGTEALYVKDPNPATPTASLLSQNYLESTGVTAATATGNTLGLQLDWSEGAAIGAELVSNPGGPFTVTTGWTANFGDISVVSGRLRSQGVSAGTSQASTSFTTVIGGLYRIRHDLSGTSSALRLKVGTSSGGSQYYQATSAGAATAYFVATTATAYISLQDLNSASDTDYSEIGYAYAQRIAGNHLYQATAADEPSLIFTGGLWRLRGDGVSDNFLTTWYPAASSTMMVACEFNAVSDLIIGAEQGANTLRFNTAGTGKAQLWTGATVTNISAATIVDIPGIFAARVTGTSFKGWWRPYNSSTFETAEGTFTGSIPTTYPVRILSVNDDGAASTAPADGDIYRALAIQSALTDDEIATIATQWARELRWTP